MFNLHLKLQDIAKENGEVCKVEMGEYFQPNSEWSHFRVVTPEGFELTIEAVLRRPKNEPDRD